MSSKSVWIMETDVTRTAEETQGMTAKEVTEILYDEYGRKINQAETAADNYGGRDVGQQEQRKWSDSKSEIRLIEIGKRGDEGVGKIKPSLLGK